MRGEWEISPKTCRKLVHPHMRGVDTPEPNGAALQRWPGTAVFRLDDAAPRRSGGMPRARSPSTAEAAKPQVSGRKNGASGLQTVQELDI